MKSMRGRKKTKSARDKPGVRGEKPALKQLCNGINNSAFARSNTSEEGPVREKDLGESDKAT